LAVFFVPKLIPLALREGKSLPCVPSQGIPCPGKPEKVLSKQPQILLCGCFECKSAKGELVGELKGISFFLVFLTCLN
jgi:hypothetical protein